jgi:hypothetical protein
MKGILPDNHSFQGGERLMLFQKGLSSNLKKHMYLSKQTHLY